MFENNKGFSTDCESNEVFWTTTGVMLNNIYDLENYLKKIDDKTFFYHVNLDNNKNDFADWIRSVFSQIEIANELEGIVDKHEYLSIIIESIRKYEKS